MTALAHQVGERDPVERVLQETTWDARLTTTARDLATMRRSREEFADAVRRRPAYGVTSGFGPLVEYAADPDQDRQGLGLVHHLCVGQGDPLPPEVVRTMVWLRLNGMRLGHSAVRPEVWETLADHWNSRFTPVVPADGSLSASGDLVPLAHAALAATGTGRTWGRAGDEWLTVAATDHLRDHRLKPVHWDARSALAFVNGSSGALARTLHNHTRLRTLARASALATGRLVALLGASTQPYRDELVRPRGHAGIREAAASIRAAATPTRSDQDRPLQEPYSLRCAPQVIGAVLGQLTAQGAQLAEEARGCSDNPVLVDGELLHGGNFHAATIGLASECYAGCVHQLSFLAERQLALLVDPRHNGVGLPMLTAGPGPNSGLAGVQLAATAHLGAIRQAGYPASFTAVPTNLGNQDHVPLALNGANAVAGMLNRAWRVCGSLFLAATQLAHLSGRPAPEGIWRRVARRVPPVLTDRPLADEVDTVARTVERFLAPA